MKTIKFLLVACLLGMAATASAQFANSGAAGGDSSDAEAWSGIRLSYNPVSYSIDAKGVKAGSLTGFSASYVKSFKLSSNVPLFIETGIGLSYISGDIAEVSDTDFDYDDFEDYEDAMEDIEDFSAMAGDLKMFSAYIPVNFGYKYSFNESWSIFPHAGITLRGNISGKLKGKNFDVYGDSDDTELNVFDKKDMDKTWKRFQIGWQIGAGVNYNKFYLSASYGTDFSEITEKSKLKTTSITIGYNF